MFDIHSHILPGIDDGAKTLAESVETCLKVAELGTTAIVATPHMHDGHYRPCPTPELTELLTQLRVEVGDRVEILLGCELRLTENTIKQLCTEKSVPTINNSRYVLLEFPSHFLPHGYQDAIARLVSNGIVPVIAHPECNRELMAHPEKLVKLIQMGAITQLDAMSLLGEYGPDFKSAALQMLFSNLLHIVASDTHCHRRPFRLHAGVAAIEKLCGPEIAQKMAVDNPKAVIENRSIPYLPQPDLKAKYSARWSAFMKTISNSFNLKK